MEGIDQEKAARVWQRVQNRAAPAAPAPAGESLPELLLQSQALAGIYLGLQRRFSGKDGETIRSLYQQHRDLACCLRGLCLAADRAVPKLPPMEAGSGGTRDQLLSAARRELWLRDCLGRETGEFQPVFARLCDQAAARAQTALMLTGRQVF